MTARDRAIARARGLRDELLARGFPRVSIELQPGRPGTPNDRWYDTRFVGCLGHHTVSRRSQGATPVLAIVKHGRSDLPGPLANGYLGYDLVPRIICLGWANHPGAGGPLTLPGVTIPRDNGRPYLFGWEHEGGLSEADWDHNAGEMRDAMGACHAATLAWLGRDQRFHREHKHWAPTRKIDRLGYSLADAHRELVPYLTGSLEEDGMKPLEHGDNVRGGTQVPAWHANDIGELQQALNDLAGQRGDTPTWWPLEVDEQYGDATAAAVGYGKDALGYRGSGRRATPGFVSMLHGAVQAGRATPPPSGDDPLQGIRVVDGKVLIPDSDS